MRVRIPDDVAVGPDGLYDSVRDHHVPCNSLTLQALQMLDDGDTLDNAARRLAPQDPQGAAAQLRVLVQRLRDASLVNTSVDLPGAAAWLRGIRRGILGPPPLWRCRYALPANGVLPLLTVIAWGALTPIVLILLTSLILLSALSVPHALAFAAGAGGGLILHEALHVIALRPWRGFLLATVTSVRVVHLPLPSARRRMVAMAGPVPVGASGMLLLITSDGATLQTMLGAGLSIHILSLMPIAPDGKSLLYGTASKETPIMSLVKPFIAGTVTVIVAALLFALAASMGGPSSWAGKSFGFPGLPVLSIQSSPRGLAVGYGPGLLILAVALGALNALAAGLLARKER